MPDVIKWKHLADEFEEKWNMPNCCGSLDMKHLMHQGMMYHSHRFCYTIKIFYYNIVWF